MTCSTDFHVVAILVLIGALLIGAFAFIASLPLTDALGQSVVTRSVTWPQSLALQGLAARDTPGTSSLARIFSFSAGDANCHHALRRGR